MQIPERHGDKMSVTERFLRYVKVNTESKDEQETVPSTECQWELAKLLVEELKEIGAEDVVLADHCYVYATIPATVEEARPVLGLIAHVDTSEAVTGEGVKPQIIKNYDGKEICLNGELQISMGPEQFPELLHYVGNDLIVTDGTTLLGADDKAGVAEIMTVAEYLIQHPEIPHGKIRIGFTPDEEVGRGVDFFDVEGFGADFAYTIDGGEIGEIEYENFNAASGNLTIHGVSVHPGTAKNKMINALMVGMEFEALLPKEQKPEYTDGYDGFFHLSRMEGGVETAYLHYIIRDHDKEKFEEKKRIFARAAAYLNEVYGADTVVCEIRDSYYNMKEMIAPHEHLIKNAVRAMEKNGIVPKIVPIRGGTDGARLSYMGLPCPNLCTGGGNFHGKYEYVSIQSMERIVKMLIDLVSDYCL